MGGKNNGQTSINGNVFVGIGYIFWHNSDPLTSWKTIFKLINISVSTLLNHLLIMVGNAFQIPFQTLLHMLSRNN